jgi:hypothetical protein
MLAHVVLIAACGCKMVAMVNKLSQCISAKLVVFRATGASRVPGSNT